LSVESRKSGDGSFGGGVSFPLTRAGLVKLRQRAWRRGCWFRDLKRKERVLLDLTIRVVEEVRSFSLARLVSGIVGKLCEAMESRVYRLSRSEGRRMALELSETAQSWGYGGAKSWVRDRSFMQFLVVNSLGELGK
jgi:hypothetical protein